MISFGAFYKSKTFLDCIDKFTELITYILVNVVQVLLKYAYSFTDSVGEDAFSVNIVQDSGARV